MARDIAVGIEGLKELRRDIRELGDKELGRGLKVANKGGAQLVVAAALPNVPVGRTAALKRTVRALASQATGRAVAGGARVPYAAAVHWGTGPREGMRGPHNIARRPFLLDAAERLRGRIEEEYLEEFDRLLDRVRSEKGRPR